MNTTHDIRRPFTSALRDGTSIAIRALGDGEQQPVLDVFQGLSPNSRYLRYLAPVRELSPHLLRQLTRLDDRDRIALAAFCGSRAVGEVRFVRLPDEPGTADLAISVIDEMQRRGLGRLLLRTAAARAAERGIVHFGLIIHPENHPSLGLARSFETRLRVVDGLYEGRLPVNNLLLQIPEQRTA